MRTCLGVTASGHGGDPGQAQQVVSGHGCLSLHTTVGGELDSERAVEEDWGSGEVAVAYKR